MSWSTVGKLIAKTAPVLGAAIGGPVGSAAAGLVASVFGTDNSPESVASAIKNDPESINKLVELEKAWVAQSIAQANMMTEQTMQINTTMREELKSDSRFKSGWRPFFGWSFGCVFVLFVLVCICALVYAPFSVKSNVIYTGTVDLIMALKGLLEVGFLVLGVNIGVRSFDKRKSGNNAGNLISRVSNMFK